MKLLTATSGWILAGQKLLSTQTAGQSWTDITPPLEKLQALNSAYFVDVDHGWAVLHTPPTDEESPHVSVATMIDRGKNWPIVDLSKDKFFLDGAGDLSSFSFTDPAHGWLIVQEMSSSSHSTADLFSTTDGGNTWTVAPRPPVFGEIKFFADYTGWLVGGVNGR